MIFLTNAPHALPKWHSNHLLMEAGLEQGLCGSELGE